MQDKSAILIAKVCLTQNFNRKVYKGNGTIKQNTPSPLTSTRVRAVKMMWVEENNKITLLMYYDKDLMKERENII